MKALSIKQDFPLLRESSIIYLDSAATSQKPEVVINAISTFYRTENAPVHRGIYELAERATALYEDARAAVAAFMNAEPAEIVFTSGTTDSINRVAQAWAAHHLKVGDEIVLPESEHHANLLVWQQLARTHGFILKYVPLRENFSLDFDAFIRLITQKTKLVTLSLSSHIFGNYPEHALKAVVARAHEVGAAVLADAAQAIGHMPLDVQTLGADFVAWSGHKLFGPTGIGVLYIHKKRFPELQVYQVGGGMVHEVCFPDGADSTWKEMPYKLEAGTPPCAQAIGLHAALEYHKQKISYALLKEHYQNLYQTLVNDLAEFDDIVMMRPAYREAKSSHLLSFYSKTFHAHDIAAWLAQEHIAVRAGHHCAQPAHQRLGIPASVRISFHAYTTHDDVAAVKKSLQRLYKQHLPKEHSL